MTTKVFISWSGETSNKIANALCDWLPAVLQFAKPYFTPNDIEKGAKWASEIGKNLAECDVGIICLTRDNLEKPWILFEAGALSKSYDKSYVCTALFGIEATDVKPPLANFQNTQFNKDDFKKLVDTINKAGKESSLPESVVATVFEKWWPDLESAISKILHTSKGDNRTSIRSDRDILEEILELNRSFSSKNRAESEFRNSIPNGWFDQFVEAIEQLVRSEEMGPSLVAYDALSELVTMAGYLDLRFSSGRRKADLGKLLGLIKKQRDDFEIPF